VTSALDSALAAIEREEADALIKAKCIGLVHGYDARWRDVEWECLCAEEEFHLPIINPETNRESRTFTHAGKRDGVIRYVPSGKSYLLEHKTTSEDISKPDAVYWRRLRIDSQLSHYLLANWQLGMKLDGAVYDVVRKPAIKPSNIDGAQLKELLSWGTYYGFKVSTEDRSLKRENERLYALRLARLCIDEPDKYFQRRTFPRLDSEVLEFSEELWDIAKSIQEVRLSGRNYRNSSACVQYNTPCEYLSVCSGEDNLESERWQHVDTLHAELPVLSGDHRDVLTNTRIQCFQQCRRKHQIRYELGIRRRDDDESESLALGSLWHKALESWWLTFRREPANVDNRISANAADGTDARLESGDFHEGERTSL
jgi:PD-(D/E)XK nuclease superfamily